MATQAVFSPQVSSTWTNVTSDNLCQSTLSYYGDTHYCSNYKVDNNNSIEGAAWTNTTFNVDDFTNATTLLDPLTKPPNANWQNFHNVCNANKCIGFSVSNVGPGNTNMVYYPCLQTDPPSALPTTTNKPSNFSTTNLGTVIVNNTSTNCLPNCPKPSSNNSFVASQFDTFLI